MIADKLGQFSLNQTLAGNVPFLGNDAGAPIQFGQNIIDLGMDRDLGEGSPLYVRWRVRTAFTDGSGTTSTPDVRPRLMVGIVFGEAQNFTQNAAKVSMSSMIGGHGGNATGIGTAFVYDATLLLTGIRGVIPGGLVSEDLTAGATFYLGLPLASEPGSSEVRPAHLKRYIGVVAIQPTFVGNYFATGAMDIDLVHTPRTSVIGGYSAGAH